MRVEVLLLGFCFVKLVYALGWLLHPLSLMGYGYIPAQGQSSYKSVRDLVKWKKNPGRELGVQDAPPPLMQASMHMAAANMGFGDKFNRKKVGWSEGRALRTRSVVMVGLFRNHYAARVEINSLASHVTPGKYAEAKGMEEFLLHVANHTVFHICNAFVLSYDYRSRAFEETFRPCRTSNSSRISTFCSQQLLPYLFLR